MIYERESKDSSQSKVQMTNSNEHTFTSTQENSVSESEDQESSLEFNNAPESENYTAEVACEKKLTMVLGVPGAGKSTIAPIYSAKDHARLIDSNVVKTFIPEFVENPSNASLVHEESSNIAKSIYQRAILRGENIIYLKVGDEVDKIDALLKIAKEQDYEITLIYVETLCNLAQARVLRRFLNTRFFINPKLVSSYYNEDSTCKVKNTFDALKSKVDHYIRYTNNVVNEKPIIVEQG